MPTVSHSPEQIANPVDFKLHHYRKIPENRMTRKMRGEIVGKVK